MNEKVLIIIESTSDGLIALGNFLRYQTPPAHSPEVGDIMRVICNLAEEKEKELAVQQTQAPPTD